MRNKVAKRIKSFARSITVGKPEVAYELTKKHQVNHTFNKKDGPRVVPIMCGTIVMDNTCTRAIYKGLKQQYKKGVK